MATEGKPLIERFRVVGNVLKLTRRFDPRYQSRAGSELMDIVSSLASEGEGNEVVLDISDAVALPSMMIGILYEAKDLTGKAGKKLKIRIKETTYNRLKTLGLGGYFSPPEGGGVHEDLELIADEPTAE